jgi:magnesium chelatase subunit D
LHVLATLRAAAPKQKLRGAKAQGRIAIRAEDFHVHRYQQHSSSCLILALDASGSAALQRLAEAKGAVELLLQQSYARRDSVCIVAFRGAHAQLLLPMTRSLVRAKRAMTGLPGGGGTPLALALKMACEQAAQLHRQGVTPILVVLSDGRANVTLQGLGGRAQAQADACNGVRNGDKRATDLCGLTLPFNPTRKPKTWHTPWAAVTCRCRKYKRNVWPMRWTT